MRAYGTEGYRKEKPWFISESKGKHMHLLKKEAEELKMERFS